METTASSSAHARSVFDVIRSAWRRYSGDGFQAKAASLGLFTVLVGASVFGMWSAVSIRRSAERAITSNTLSDHYEDAASAVAAEESLERKYRLEPGHEARLRFEKASADVGAAMELVRRDGNSEDRTIADQVTLAYGPYLRAIDQMFDAVDRGETRLVLQIDSDEVDPRFDRIEELVTRAEDNHRAAAIADLAHLQAQENFNARATPAVFLGGLMLVALFSSVLRRTRAQLDDQRVKAVHDALHDALTGLPNRTLMSDRFEQALRAGKRASSTTALLLIDLDRFKDVNDTLGHQVGDQLLAQIGPRLVGALRDSDTVARLGGDEFAVLLPDVDGLTGALDVAARLRATLADPFTVDGVELDVDASIGVVISGAHGENAIELLQHADVAMYVAKQQKRGVVVYDPANDGHSPERLSLLGDLRHGIERGELFLHYQPKVSLSTGEMTGVEALVRWQHPEHGLIPPDDFIPLAEHTGLIGPLTIWVLNTALAQVKVWADGGRAVSVAVNVSARNLVDDDFAKKVAAALTQQGVPANLLEVEVTESAVMLEPDRATRILNQLHALGVRIALDDFGVGYTSLAQLKTLPISELKIDKSFILAMHGNRDDAMIVRSMVDLGHSLNMKVVAEGVETAHAASMLADYRCDTAQGYHLCRPVQAEALMHWYRERTVPQRASPSVNRSGLTAAGL